MTHWAQEAGTALGVRGLLATWPGSLRSLRLPSTSGHRLTTGSYDGQTRGYIRQETRPGTESPPNHEEHGLTRGADTFCSREGDVMGPTADGVCATAVQTHPPRPPPPSPRSRKRMSLSGHGGPVSFSDFSQPARGVWTYTPHTGEATRRGRPTSGTTRGRGPGAALRRPPRDPAHHPLRPLPAHPDLAACELRPHPRSAQRLRVWSRF